MQGRSWMAALTHIADAPLALGLIFSLGLGLPVASRADDAEKMRTPDAVPAGAAAGAGATSAAANAGAPARVLVDVRIAGLGPSGCDVEVAPGSSDCQFQPVRCHVSPQDYSYGKKIALNDVRATSTDRYCMFAITIREPGQPAKTVRRGLRLVGSPDRQETAQLLNCFLSSPSKLAKTTEMRERR